MPKAVLGETDIWTTSPSIAVVFEDKELPYTVTKGSHKKAWFICPNCGNRVYDVIRKVSARGVRCPVCSDGISYGEKFISNLLNQLGVSFIHDKTLSWSNNKRYDFYIEDMSIIIEAHGKQHYDANMYNVTCSEEHDNDEYKRILAFDNGITEYIEIDCYWSDFEYIKSSVLNSKLNDIFDLSNVNWDVVFNNCASSRMIQCCDMWNSGVRSVDKIATYFGYDNDTVRDYLKQCHAIGMCDYTPNCHREVPDSAYKAVICVDTKKIYSSMKSVKDDGYCVSQVCECCNGNAKTAGGHNWCYYDEYDPNTYVMNVSNGSGTPKKVRCIETGKIYNKQAYVKDDGFNPSLVSKVCKGLRTHHKGYHFEYVD